MWFGQSAGLIEAVLPAAEVVRQIVSDADEILSGLTSTS
jgi:NAD(P)H-dependent flavin oxidoreductase YrpB (nitropropane dioxygenase family)